MDYLPLLYARAARSGGPCVPFWGPDLRRRVAICPGAKEGRAGAADPPWVGARCFNGTSARTRVEPCMPQLVLPGSLERWAMCPMFACAGLPQGGPGAGQACGLVDAPNVAQQRCRLKVLDFAVTKAKPRKVERCSVKNADSKCLMDRRFVRIAGRRLRVAPR